MLPSSGPLSCWGTHGGQGSPRIAALPSAWLEGARQHLPMQPKPMAEGLEGKWHQHLNAEQLRGLGQGPRQRVPTWGSGFRPPDGDFPPLAPSTSCRLCPVWGHEQVQKAQGGGPPLILPVPQEPAAGSHRRPRRPTLALHRAFPDRPPCQAASTTHFTRVRWSLPCAAPMHKPGPQCGPGSSMLSILRAASLGHRA